ncbi:MAG: chemotaxis protein CheW [Candidatus Omnitrophota bacterium]
MNVRQMQGLHYLEFTLGGKQFALPLSVVDRVVHAVEVMRLPKGPDIVCGLINYKGQIIPIINISRRFHLPERTLDPDQYFIIMHSNVRKFGLLADNIHSVTDRNPDLIISPTDIMAGVEFLSGIIKLPDGLMLIPDLDKLLTHDEDVALKKVMPNETRDATH